MLTGGRRTVVIVIAAAVLCGVAAVVGVVLLRDDGDGQTWNYYRADRDRLEIVKTVRSCDKVVGAEAEETNDRVVVTLHVDFGGVCGSDAVDKSATVALAEPLGGRPVYDAACLNSDRSEPDCLRSARD